MKAAEQTEMRIRPIDYTIKIFALHSRFEETVIKIEI